MLLTPSQTHSAPVWDSDLLNEICSFIRDTGRAVGGMPLSRL
jgi:hypothetical protein